MYSMENDNLRNEIIAKVPPLDLKFWSYYDDALNEMNKAVWTRISPNIRSSQPMAFATRSKGTTGVFEIYVNPNVPYECKQPLELHEFGHVIFTHMSLLDTQREIIIRKIMSYWHNFEKHIEDEAIKTTEDIKKVSKVICNAMLNIAMDYEVNSKLFTEEEWPIMVQYTQWASLMAAACAPKSTKEELEACLEWLNNEDPDKEPMFKPCWPADAGFPLGKDYRQYLDLMLMKPDNAMEQIKNMINQMKQQGGQGEENGSGDGEGQGSGSGKLSKGDIDKLRQTCSDADSSANEAAKSEAEEEDNKEKGLIAPTRRKQSNENGWAPNGSDKYDDEEISIENNKALEKKLLNEIFNKHISNTKQDSMYYYNRQKYASSIMISKDRPEDLYRPGDIYMIVDCSGSIGQNAINALTGAVKKVAKKCGAHSRIIWWDTELQGDYKIRKNLGPQGSGGTWIADGIKYVREKYLKRSNDKLVIISDYQDSLNHWLDELEKMHKNDCVGICWRTVGGWSNYDTGTEYLRAMCRCSDGDDTTFMNKFLKKLPTTLVRIPYGFN